MDTEEWVPRYLYKYVTYDGLIRLLTNGKVRFTQPSHFNDPFEFLPAIHKSSIKKIIRRGLLAERTTTFKEYDDDAFLAGLSKALYNEEGLSQTNRELYENYLKEWDKTMGVFCLTSDPSNILMWSHYASEFRGGVLGLRTDSSFFREDNDLNLVEVGYRKKRPIVVIDQNKYQRFRNQSLTHEIFAIKSNDWAYEKEFRMFSLLSKIKAEPDNPSLYLVQLPQDSPYSVILGPRMEESHKENIERIKNTYFKDIFLCNAILDSHSFKVNIIKS